MHEHLLMQPTMMDVMAAERRSGRIPVGLRGLSGTSDDLDRVLREAGDNSGELRNVLDTAISQMRENAGSAGALVERVGGQLLELKSVIQATSPDAPNYEAVIAGVLSAMAAVASAAGCAYAGAVMAAVQILWRLAQPGLHAISDSLSYITRADALFNQCLNTLHYASGAPVGGRGRTLDMAAATELLRDGWYPEIGPSGGQTYPFGANSFANFCREFATVSGTRTACQPSVVNGVAISAWTVVNEASRAVDSMYDGGDVAGARVLWEKCVRILDTTFINGRARFERVSGIPAGAIVGLDRYPWGTTGMRPASRFPGYTGSGLLLRGGWDTKEQAGNPANNLVLFGGAYHNVVHGGDAGRRDIVLFKPSRFPVDFAAAIVNGMFVNSDDELPCDTALRWFVHAAVGQLDTSLGWPLSVWGSALLEREAEIRKAAKDAAAGRKSAPVSSTKWSTTKKVVVAGAVAGGGTGLYFLGRALRWWK